MVLEKKKKYTLKDDILFKAFFSRKGNEEFLIDFLNALLKIQIHTIRIKEEVNLEQLSMEEKGGRLDLQAEINDGTIVSIEMQMRDEKNTIERTESYGANVKARNSQRGEEYIKQKNVIMINILNYVIFPEYKEYVVDTALVLRQHKEYELPSGEQYYFIELPKFRKKNIDINNKLEQWLVFIDATNKEAVKMAVANNKVLKKAEAEYTYLTGDEAQRRLEELRIKWAIDRAYEKAEGIKAKTEEIAKNMLNRNMKISEIAELTGLSEEEIKKMQ